MPVAAAIGIGSVAGGLISSNASKKAAKTQAAAADNASAVQQAQYEQTREDLSPYTNAGTTALSQLMGKMGDNGYFNQTYSGQDTYDDPSYKFRLQQGLDSVQSGAAGQGGLLSGATQKALSDYGQQSASQEYQNAYNRFNADQSNQYNRLSNLVGVGQNAAAGVGNAGAQTAQSVANNAMLGANASAAGQIGAANSLSNMIGGLGSAAIGGYQNYKSTGSFI